MSDSETVRVGDDVKSRITTTKQFGPFVQDGYRVIWIDWDSAFRDTDLRIGDVIVALDQIPYVDVSDGNVSGSAIGQAGEEYMWSQNGGVEGRPVTLTVVRGDTRLDIVGELRPERFPVTSGGQAALAPGGPGRMASDPFAGAWAMWYEDIVNRMSFILDGAWERTHLNNAKELADHLEHVPRLDYLLEHHPGPLADTLRSDWEKVRESLVGRRYELTEDDLAYRELGETRALATAAAARTAWQACIESLTADTRETFPAPDPDRRAEEVGRIVALPWMGHREMINDLDKTWLVAGSSRDGFYFVDAESATARRFFTTYYRARALVKPDMPERYRFIGRILDDPRMITFQRTPVIGLVVEIVVGMAGAGDGELFMDLREPEPDTFAGEAELKSLSTLTLSDDQTPRGVLETMISAIQMADRDTWKQVFANWRAWAQTEDRAYFNPANELPDHVFMRPWERARMLMLGDVFNVRVHSVTPIRRLAEADPETGRPRIEEVTAYLDHIGLIDGEYRAFSDVNVNRAWVLQRLDDGPWRVTDVNAL